jgi:hypothetical protein
MSTLRSPIISVGQDFGALDNMLFKISLNLLRSIEWDQYTFETWIDFQIFKLKVATIIFYPLHVVIWYELRGMWCS